jgi:hypothetical protein
VDQKLNIRPETSEQLQEIVGTTLEHIGIGNNFLNRTQKAQHLRKRMNKWDCIKLKIYEQQKKQSQDLRDCPQKGRKTFPAIYPMRD